MPTEPKEPRLQPKSVINVQVVPMKTHFRPSSHRGLQVFTKLFLNLIQVEDEGLLVLALGVK